MDGLYTENKEQLIALKTSLEQKNEAYPDSVSEVVIAALHQNDQSSLKPFTGIKDILKLD